MSDRPLVVVAGKALIAVRALEHLVALKESGLLPMELAVIPNRDDDSEDTWMPSLRRAAARLCVEEKALRDVQGEARLVLFSLEFDRIVRTQKFASDRLYNIHFSDLPRYRGTNMTIWPLLHGEDRAGVTLHWMTPGIDDGPIIDQKLFEVSVDETSQELYMRFLREGFVLFRTWCERAIRGEVPRLHQDEENATYFSREDMDYRRARVLTLDMNAQEIVRRARAFNFPVYQRAEYRGMPVDAAWILGESSSPPGSVLAEREGLACVVAADSVAVAIVVDAST